MVRSVRSRSEAMKRREILSVEASMDIMEFSGPPFDRVEFRPVVGSARVRIVFKGENGDLVIEPKESI